jgi:hypothetical protein
MKNTHIKTDETLKIENFFSQLKTIVFRLLIFFLFSKFHSPYKYSLQADNSSQGASTNGIWLSEHFFFTPFILPPDSQFASVNWQISFSVSIKFV